MNNHKINAFLLKGCIFSLLIGFLAGQTVSAADCKGLSKSRCESSSSCTWVGGYVSKSGKKVSSYCRAKPKSSKAVTKSSGKASSSGRTEKSKAEEVVKKKPKKKDAKKEKESTKKSTKKKTESKKKKSDKKKSDKKKKGGKKKKTGSDKKE